MLKTLWASFLAFFLAAPQPSPLATCRSWAVYYGQGASVENLRGPDLLVLEPGHGWEPDLWRRDGQKVLAYLSLGEVHVSRPYAERLATAGALSEANPDWPDARRIDPRSPVWRTLVLEELAPSLLAAGYDGFFLDTLDAAEAMEPKFPGAKRAMAELLHALKARHPKALLVANGGTALLDGASDALDALATESVFTDYQFRPKRYQRRAEGDARERASYWQELSGRYHLPVFVLEYAERGDAALRREAYQQASQAGFVPFVSEIGLNAWEDWP